EPTHNLAKQLNLPEPYMPLVDHGRTIRTLAWSIPVTSSARCFHAAQRAFKEAVRRGDSLPWYVQSRTSAARVVWEPWGALPQEWATEGDRVMRRFDQRPKGLPGRRKKITDEQLRAHFQQYPDGPSGLSLKARGDRLGVHKTTVGKRAKA